MYGGAGYKPEFFHDRRWHAVKTQAVGAEAVDMSRLVWRQHCRHAELGMTAVAPETPNYTDPDVVGEWSSMLSNCRCLVAISDADKGVS